MVTLNCGNFCIIIYKNRLKTNFDKNQCGVSDTNGIWFEIDTSKCKDLVKDNLLDEFFLSLVKKFIKLNEQKIEDLIALNVEFCIGIKFKTDQELNYHKFVYSYDILFLNIELNLFYSEKYIYELFNKDLHNGMCDIGDKKEKFDYLMPELRQFFAIQNAKQDLLIKRECVFNLKLKLMEYRTSIANNMSSRSITELEINQKSLLKYLYEIAKQVEKLKIIEDDLDFELELLKVINQDHFNSLKELFKKEDAQFAENSTENCYNSNSGEVKIDLNCQEFYNRVKVYNFKTKHCLFFRTYFVQKENEYLNRLNQELQEKIKLHQNE